jgi:hypothetical protein
MVWAIAVVLGVLWAVAMANAFTARGYVHLLLVVAFALMAFGYVRHRHNSRRKMRAR